MRRKILQELRSLQVADLVGPNSNTSTGGRKSHNFD